MKGQGADKEYITWSDVHTHLRWLERGFGVRIKLTMVVACPKGEQFERQYWELHACDDELNPMDIGRRILFRFPRAGSKSLSGAMLGGLFELEGALHEALIWVEPQIGTPPGVGRP